MAFATPPTSTFLGQRRMHPATNPLRTTTNISETTRMSYSYSDKSLSKYERMSKQETEFTPVPVPPTMPSPGLWGSITTIDFTKMVSLPPSWSTATALSGRIFAVGPLLTRVDAYMASCVAAQYKRTAVSTGVYSVRCAEGAIRGQAETSRVAALGMQFRAGQRSKLDKFGDFFETRRRAIAAAHGCSYEEALNARFPSMAAALLRGASEARGTCGRYAVGAEVVEKYMAGCVDKQSKFRAVESGLYGVMCMDGSCAGMAEEKRVAQLSARFRSAQVGEIAAQQERFDASKSAREEFSHMCSYEEELFNKYPAVAASMRGQNVRYN